jgi:uncharacterized protein (TIGR02466 family)
MSTPELVINEITPFTTSIYQANLPIDTTVVNNILTLQQDPTNYKLASNQGGWHSKVYSSNDLDNDVSIGFIKDSITQLLPIAQVIYNSLGINKPVKIDGFWFMVNDKNSYNKLHNHPGSWLSGVLYLKTPRNSGRINFERPDLMYDYLDIDQVTDKSVPEYFWNPKVGDFLLFPSYLKHYVDQNLSTDNDSCRMCLAINFK